MYYVMTVVVSVGAQRTMGTPSAHYLGFCSPLQRSLKSAGLSYIRDEIMLGLDMGLN